MTLTMRCSSKRSRTFGAEHARGGSRPRYGASTSRTSGSIPPTDYWIALEGLFLPDGTTELSYRVSLRVARFVADVAADMRTVFELLYRKSYRARSKVVHGDAVPELDEIAASTGDVVRAALRRWLAAEAEPTVESIDTSLFTTARAMRPLERRRGAGFKEGRQVGRFAWRREM